MAIYELSHRSERSKQRKTFLISCKKPFEISVSSETLISRYKEKFPPKNIKK